MTILTLGIRGTGTGEILFLSKARTLENQSHLGSSEVFLRQRAWTTRVVSSFLLLRILFWANFQNSACNMNAVRFTAFILFPCEVKARGAKMLA